MAKKGLPKAGMGPHGSRDIQTSMWGLMKAARQTTLRDQVAVSGIGVHSGLPVTLTLHPADAGSGIVFLRTGADDGREREIRADVRAVTATEFATVLGDASGPLCSTAEHVLAALRGLGVDNALGEIDGPEVPIMGGSADPFVAAIEQTNFIAPSATAGNVAAHRHNPASMMTTRGRSNVFILRPLPHEFVMPHQSLCQRKDIFFFDVEMLFSDLKHRP